MVDLPQPDGPVTVTDSPRSIRRLSPFRALIIPLSKYLQTLSISTAGPEPSAPDGCCRPVGWGVWVWTSLMAQCLQRPGHGSADRRGKPAEQHHGRGHLKRPAEYV